MATQDSIVPLHRGARLREGGSPLPPANIEWIEQRFRDDAPVHLEISGDYRSTFDKITDALASPRMFIFYLGFYAGCMATVGFAMLWELAR